MALPIEKNEAPRAPERTLPEAVAQGRRRGPLAYLKAIGPGLVTGAADDDPSGIATYAQAGATYRFATLWILLVSLPLMIAMQLICDRAALATGKSLGALAVDRFEHVGRRMVAGMLVALFVADAVNVAADLAAVGQGMHLLHLGPPAIWALVAGVAATALLVFGSFRLVARVFNALALVLLSYVVVLFIVHPSWTSVVSHLLVPHVQLSKGYILMLVAILGTTISPYLFVWQTGHRVEEMREEKAGGPRAMPLQRYPRSVRHFKKRVERIDVAAGMVLSQVVAFAIIVVTASTIGAHGTVTIHDAAQAATALRPLAGRFAEALFALGFIGSGMLAVPVLIGSASLGIAGLSGRQWGFSRPLREAPLFYWLIAAGVLGGTLLSVLPINLFRLLVLVAVVNGLLGAPFVVVVMLIAGDRKIVGEQRNSRLILALGWATAALLGASAVALVAANLLP
jgi:NRAMP (natural resistance-associated macrophage protein)-like metal ion transporter